MATVIATNRRRPRLRLLALGAAIVVALGALAAYAFVAVVNQPLTAGSTFEIVPGKVAVSDLQTDYGQEVQLLDYVPGASVTINQALANTGEVSVLVTGVETSPSTPTDSIFSITDARAAVPASLPCCGAIDETATWSASGFKPMQLGTRQEVAVALRLVINRCQHDNGVDSYQSLASINVYYSVLGVSHVQEVFFFEPVGVKVPASCPA